MFEPIQRGVPSVLAFLLSDVRGEKKLEQLETERLILRPFRKNDLADFYSYASKPEVGPPAGWNPHSSLEESEKILLDFIRQDDIWALEEKGAGKVIGSVGLHKDPRRDTDHTKMLGYAMDSAFWGRGLMPEAVRAAIAYAFDKLGTELLSVYHYPFNHRSKRVIQKSGFTYEGTLRYASQIFDGSVYDMACYSMTKAEYRERCAKTKA